MQKKTMWIVGITVVVVTVIALAVALPLTLTGDDDNNNPRVFIGRMALDDVPLIDGHNDLPYNLYLLRDNKINDFPFDSDLTQDPVWGPARSSYTDLPRLRQGKVGGQFWVAYVSCTTTQYKDSVERTLEQIDVIKRLIEKYPNDMQYATTAVGIMDAFNNGKIASLIAVEGGHSMDSRLSVLRMYHELGVRYMTLTHSCNQPWADASPIDDNSTAVKLDLTDWGKLVIREMNRLGIMVDLSHVSHGVMHAVLDVTTAPVIFSHSSAYSIYAHHRNVRDDVLQRVKENNGVVMVNFYSFFVAAADATIIDVAKHINHIRDEIGADYVGIGGDYDGVETQPTGLEDVSKYPDLFDLLAEDGHGWVPWTEGDLRKLAGLNLLRVFREVEIVASVLQKTTNPSEELIPEVDLYNTGADQSCRTDYSFTPTEKFVNAIQSEKVRPVSKKIIELCH